MANQPQPSPHPNANQVALEPGDIRGIRERFLTVNRQRISLVRNALRDSQELFLDALPILLQVNNPSLPGYVSKDTPCGISNYTPGKDIHRVIRRISRTVNQKSLVPRSIDIDAVMMMGSTGTVAYSAKSDLDIWLCHRADLSAEQIEALRGKTDRLSTWADSLGLEVHFFLLTAKAIRSAKFEAMSTESSGTAQHHLLLDEFYRSMTLIAGRYPLWWFVPPGHERQYQQYTRDLLQKRFVREDEVIDLGAIHRIPLTEFFGASLWQLYKAIGSPYKSLLKILLLESYSTDVENIDLLCHAFKRNVYAGATGMNDTDPYLLLVNRVETYLKTLQDDERLQVARHAFYFKINRPLSRQATTENEQLAVLHTLIAQWGWDRNKLAVLDARPEWKINRVLTERKHLVNSLMRAYKRLSALAKDTHQLATISRNDMNLLGRRLFVAFEKKPGKIELVNPGISRDLSEPGIRLRQATDGSWQASRRTPGDADSRQSQILHRAGTLLELLAWLQVNGVINASTDFQIDAPHHNLDTTRLRQLVRQMNREFPRADIANPGTEALSRSVTMNRYRLFINLEATQDSDAGNVVHVLGSETFDPLNYGPQHRSCCLAIDLLYASSWGEYLLRHFDGDNCLAQTIAELTRLQIPNNGLGLSPQSSCFDAINSQLTEHRVQQVVDDAVNFLLSQKNSRFILREHGQYQLIRRDDASVTTSRYTNDRELFDALRNPVAGPVVTRFDRRNGTEPALAFACKVHTPGHLQVYYQMQQAQMSLVIVDPQGALITDQRPVFRESAALAYTAQFFDNVTVRENNARSMSGNEQLSGRVDLFRLEADPGGEMRRQEIWPDKDAHTRQTGMELKIYGQLIGAKRGFAIFLNNEEYSTLEHGKKLFLRVAQAIVKCRSNGETYPIHITDIDLNHMAPHGNPGTLQIIDYYYYKKVIEHKLNKALSRLR